MTDREVNIDALAGQCRLLESAATADVDHVLFVAGVASGKTVGGTLWVLLNLTEQPEAKGFIGAQSYQQLNRVSLPALFSLLDQAGIRYIFNKKPPDDWGQSRFPEHDGIISVQMPGVDRPAQIQTGTMENYAAHRGIDFGWCWLDESREMVVEAFDVMLSRLRGQPAGTRYRTLNTTTPNGFGWLHKRFVSEAVPRSAVVRASTTENPFLPPGFVETLRAQYTERFARQEIDGEFLNLIAGQAYYAFRRDLHVKSCPIDSSQPMWYSADFNVSPLCSTFGQSTKLDSTVCGEIYIAGSGRTADAAEEFCRRLEKHDNKTVSIYGDMSGANQNTRNDATDYDIMVNVMKSRGWRTTLLRNYVNPPFIESIEAVNNQLEKQRCAIDPACKRLITDLEQVCYQDGTRVLAKDNKELTHLSDSWRYMIFREYAQGGKASASNLL